MKKKKIIVEKEMTNKSLAKIMGGAGSQKISFTYCLISNETNKQQQSGDHDSDEDSNADITK